MPRKGTIRPDNAVNRKSKAKAKAQVEGTQADDQGVLTDEGENTMNVTQVEAQEGPTVVEFQEPIPATQVEVGEAEVFAGQTDGQVTAQVEVLEPEVQEPAATEKPKKPRVNKRPYIEMLGDLLEVGGHNKKELLTLVMEKFPEVNKDGVSTFLSDALNPRYSHWKDRVVTKRPDGKLIFADRVPAEPLSEEQTTEATPEIPAE